MLLHAFTALGLCIGDPVFLWQSLLELLSTTALDALVKKVEISRWMLNICVWKVQQRDIFVI